MFRSLLKLKESARERRRESLAILDGVHLVETYAARSGAPSLLAVSASAVEAPEIRRLLENLRSVDTVVLEPELFRQIAPVTTPSGILAVVPIPASRPVSPDVDFCVLLEDIQDPGNLGAILRTAAAAGVRQALLSKGCADVWSPRVMRGAMGAHHLLAICEHADLAAFVRSYRGKVVAADTDATARIFDIDLRGPVAFALGNEGAGLSVSLRKAAHARASVPMAAGTESLNVAAAAAICLFERVRQLKAARSSGGQ
ncbi:MAG: TrmH family RNA methyltransferase [Betaproteobacteria bacterium]